jgi:hypothetical protein
MASDMLVALAPATQDGRALFGHHDLRPSEEPQAVHFLPGRVHPPGQTVQATRVSLAQVRQTWSVLGGRSGGEWGCRYGVNEKGLAAGVTTISTRLRHGGPALTGPDLVRLTLERAASAVQAVEVLGDLIARHGQEGDSDEGSDNAFALADGGEAYVVEACGSHWAEQQVPAVRAVAPVCLLRRDWDRISRGLSDLAIANSWWPADGSKLDFAGALGREGPGHVAALRRWGQATLKMEQERGQVTVAMLRRLLEASAPAPTGRPHLPANAEAPTAAGVVADLGAAAGRLPLAWCAFGTLGAKLHFPLVPSGEVPAAFREDEEGGSRVWRLLTLWHRAARGDPRRRAALQAELARLQERFDLTARDFAAEAEAAAQAGSADGLRRLAGSFMQHNLDRFEELAAGQGAKPPKSPATQPAAGEDELAEIPGEYF